MVSPTTAAGACSTSRLRLRSITAALTRLSLDVEATRRSLPTIERDLRTRLSEGDGLQERNAETTKRREAYFRMPETSAARTPDLYWDWLLDPDRELRELYGRLIGLEGDYWDLHQRAEALRRRLVPRSTYLLPAVLAALVVVGLVIPLAGLTARSTITKFALLGCFTILVAVFLGYLASELRRLVNAADPGRPSF